MARGVLGAGWLADNIAGYAFVAWIAVIAVATLGHRALPRWTAWIGIPVALINLVGLFAVKARTGALSPRGWFALVVGLSFAVWLVAVSWRPRDRPALEREEGGRSLGGRYSTPPSLRASLVALPDLP